jgi:hypothetical protein
MKVPKYCCKFILDLKRLKITKGSKKDQKTTSERPSKTKTKIENKKQLI